MVGTVDFQEEGIGFWEWGLRERVVSVEGYGSGTLGYWVMDLGFDWGLRTMDMDGYRWTGMDG